MAPQSFRLVKRAIQSLSTAGAGPFTQRCEALVEKMVGAHRALMTPSCTAALEMAALLLNIQPGDEVIVPAFTFVSTANAFALRGAVIRFADSLPNHPNMDPRSVERLISGRTRAIVVVHYGGQNCDMDEFMRLSGEANVPVVEDAAQAIGASHKGRFLGSFAPLACFSFHETKNVACGEGGMLLVNQESFVGRAEVVREKGTDRSAFLRQMTKKYCWQDLGSSFLASDITAALLYAQLLHLRQINTRRRRIAAWYLTQLGDLARQLGLEVSWSAASDEGNGHLFYLVCRSEEERKALIDHLARSGVVALFHYLALNESPFAKRQAVADRAPHAERFARCLLRFPIFHALTRPEVNRICASVKHFYNSH